MTHLVLQALTELLPCEVRPGKFDRVGRSLQWIEAGSGHPAVVFEAALGEPGTLAFAAAIPAIAARTRLIAYDRAGLGTSDPAAELTLDVQVDDLAALAAYAGDGPCVLAGHSWGGLLVLLAAARYPDLVAGLVLIDPADEIYWASLPPEIHQESTDQAALFLRLHARGELAETIRESFRPFVESLTASESLRRQLLEAYVSCYSKRSQVAMLQGETNLFMDSISLISQIRTAAPLPDVPTVVLSATTGTTPEIRAKWTKVHAALAASLPRARHTVLPDTHHAINEMRPEAITEAVFHVLGELRRLEDRQIARSRSGCRGRAAAGRGRLPGARRGRLPGAVAARRQRLAGGGTAAAVAGLAAAGRRRPQTGHFGPADRNDGPSMRFGRGALPQRWAIVVAAAASVGHRCGCRAWLSSIDGPSLRLRARDGVGAHDAVAFALCVPEPPMRFAGLGDA